MLLFLRRLYSYVTSRTGLLPFTRILEWLTPVRAGRAAFLVRRNTPFSGNVRIVADALAAGGSREIVAMRATPFDPDQTAALAAAGIRWLSPDTVSGLRYLASCEHVFLSHSSLDGLIAGRKRGRTIVNLWHGVALKRIERLMREPRDSRKQYWRRHNIARNARLYDRMVASGEVDRLVMVSAFGVPFDAVLPIGLPRYDYLCPDCPLPADLAAMERRLLERLAGRRLVVYAPTFRDAGTSALLRITPEEREAIRLFCRKQRLVLGVRPHPYETALAAASGLVDGADVLDLNAADYPEGNLVLRHAAALVVDYSSIWVDFLGTRRPIVGLFPDLDAYRSGDRGFIYDLPGIFPGPIETTWAGVLARLGSPDEVDGEVDGDRRAYVERLLMPAALPAQGVTARLLADLGLGPSQDRA